MFNKMIKNGLMTVVLAAVLAIGLCGCGNTQKVDNIFEEAIKIKDGEIYFADFEFFMSKDDIINTIKKSGEATYVADPPIGPCVKSEFALEGLSNKVEQRAMLGENDKAEEVLYSVYYYMTVEEAEKADFCANLYEQAKNFMPDSKTDPESMELIKTCPEQLNIMWQGSNDAYVYLNVPATPDVEGDVIILQITAPRPYSEF